MSLSHELCKKLQDAGFPSPMYDAPTIKVDNDTYPVLSPQAFGIYSPTLSELIEACGERFGYLSKVQGEPRFMCSAPGSVGQIFGPTPEIAVALYWLALQDKG